MARPAVAALVLGLLSGPAVAELRVENYRNCAMHGQPSRASTVDGLSFEREMEGCSMEVTGTLTLEHAGFYAFDCRFDGGQLVFVWLEDHLICHTKPPFGNPKGSTDGSPQNPLVARAGERLPVVVHVYGVDNSTGLAASRSSASVDVRWAGLTHPLPADATPLWAPIPVEALVGSLPTLEVRRRQLQKALLSGWNLWSYNMLDVIRLPESFGLTTIICRLSTQNCLSETRIEDETAAIRVGPFAADQSYWQFFLGYKGINISLSYAGGNGSLHVLADPLNCAGAGELRGKAPPGTANCSDYALVVVPRYVWFRGGRAEVDGAAGSITLTPTGMGATVLRLTSPATALLLPPAVARAAAGGIAVTFGAGAVGVREGSEAPAVPELRARVAAARAAEEARYAKYGELAEVKEAMQAATLWNYIYTPAEYGPFLPVSRSWNFVSEPSNSDWNYVIFDWDNIFASYMTSLDPASKDIAYSNFIQVVRSKTARGFVPNFSAGGTKTSDRTEPPIGAKVLLEMHRRYQDNWLVELLFDDLLSWNDWFEQDRMLGPAGLVSLGSNSIGGAGSGSMTNARLESGLDNSPMYDGDFFKRNLSSQGSYLVGQMQLYDVGMASMVAQEAEALAELAPLAGRQAEAGRLRARAERQRKLIAEVLWDQQGGIFTNRFWNGTFNRRISPTSFYAMMAGAASDEQALAMVQNWLLSPKHFCIAPRGDFAGNSDDCYWGLPSIDRSDPAFPPLGYWRGYVWGPMAQLTYWSLQRYDHVPEVRSARKALCKQMTALMLSQWRKHRHICENFSPHRTADDHQGDCSGTKFYHWGALNGMITMVEEGYYGAARALRGSPAARQPSSSSIQVGRPRGFWI